MPEDVEHERTSAVSIRWGRFRPNQSSGSCCDDHRDRDHHRRNFGTVRRQTRQARFTSARDIRHLQYSQLSAASVAAKLAGQATRENPSRAGGGSARHRCSSCSFVARCARRVVSHARRISALSPRNNNSATAQSNTAQSVADHSATDHSATDHPATDGPVTDRSATARPANTGPGVPEQLLGRHRWRTHARHVRLVLEFPSRFLW